MDPVAVDQAASVQTLALDHHWKKMRSRELKFSLWSCSSWSISWRQLDFWITIWRNRDQDLMEAHHFVCSYQRSVWKSLEQVLTYWQLAPRWLREFDLATSYIAIWFLDFMKPHNCLYVNNVTLTKISNHQPCGRKGVRNAFEIDQIGQSVALTIVTHGENNAAGPGTPPPPVLRNLPSD